VCFEVEIRSGSGVALVVERYSVQWHDTKLRTFIRLDVSSFVVV